MYDLIAKLKQQYDPLFCTQLGNDYYIWRLLTREENKYLAGLELSEMDMEDAVCATCVLYPEINNWQTYKAGVAKTLFALIYNESGFKDSEQSSILYEYYKQQIETDRIKQIEIMINIAFPEITLEEMATWDAAKLWRKAAEAEYKLNTLNKIHTLPGFTMDISFNPEAAKGPDKKELAKRLREEGIDPMLTVRPVRPDTGYIKFPFIIGHEDFIFGTEWEEPTVNEGLFNEIQRQLLERKHRRQSSSSSLA